MQAAWDALERNDFRFAEAAAREVLARAPADGEALYLLGSTLLFEGRFQEALSPLSDAAARLQRRGVGYRLGHCHLALGDAARAEAALRRETQAYPDSANAHNTLGVALASQSRNEEALAEFLAALRLDGAHGEASNNTGNALRALGRDAEALPYLQSGVAAQPESADAHMNLGLVLHSLRRYEEATASFGRATALEPQLPYALGAQVWSELFACDWRELEPRIAALRAQVREGRVPAAPFTLLAVSDSPSEQRQCAELHLRESGGEAREPLWRGTRSSHPRLRLAYLSADFHQHATAQVMTRHFELHDRARFEVIGVSYGPDDGSAARRRLERAFDRFVDVAAMSDAQAARLLREMQVDIAVDLKGHTANSRMALLAWRPAPLQATYMGYPGPVAASYIDYVLADGVVIPPPERQFYPQVALLPESYWVNDSTVTIAERTPPRSELGLPGDAFVFCCFNNAWKLTPRLFAVWMRLLAAQPGSVLWLLENNAAATRNLRESAREKGIDPARLVFAPRLPLAEHLARHRQADLFLDTLPYNAHTTATDALWAGLPVLTCRGTTFAGRVAASLLGAIGLPELITESLADYEALALELARDKEALAAARAKLARHRLTRPLFDSERSCRSFEAAYQRMWEIHQRGEAPRSFEVPAR